MSAGRAYRLWRAAGLQVPRKRPRRRVASGRPRPQAPTGANQVWSYDFVFDRCANGQQLKCLTVTDEWTREGLAIEVDGRIRSGRVIEVLARLVSERGAPLYLRSDNGPEFVSRALLAWITAQGIETALIDPGKPWQNGAGESFNGKFRDECLSLEWFRSRAEAKAVIESWRRHYNEVRPHSSWATDAGRVCAAGNANRGVSGWQRAGALRCVGPPRPGPLRDRPMRGNRQKRGQPSQANPGPKKQGRSHQMGLFMIFRQKWPRRPLRPPSRPRPAAGWPAIRVCLRRRSPRAATASPIPCPKYSTARSCRCSTPRRA